MALLAGCPGGRSRNGGKLADPVSSNEGNIGGSITTELQNDVLTSYERDEAPDVDTGMIPADIGGARIGVGPGDVLIASEMARAPSRWPLRVDAPTSVASKRLETHLSRDGSAAWVFDEVSWRIATCGRIAVIPLRITMLYARDGDRWVPIFEHMSFGHAPTPRLGDLYGVRMPSKSVASSDFVDELSSSMSPMLSLQPQAAGARVATGPEAILVGPDVTDEWHGLDLASAKLAAGPMKTVEDRRIGYVGRSLSQATVAYWIGNVVADLPARPGVGAGKARMRVTFVFERRRAVNNNDGATESERKRREATSCAEDSKDCHWVMVQGHVSQPIGDSELATQVFGTALLSGNLESGEPLELACE
jgi:hypothetical protein